eukprot:s2819_g6.t1
MGLCYVAWLLLKLHVHLRTPEAMPKRALDEKNQEKLKRALNVRGASERAVGEIWNIIQPEESQISRGSLLRTVDENLSPWKAALTDVRFKDKNGSELFLPVVDLKACLDIFCSQSEAFRNVLTQALEKNGRLTPLLFCDEATAGNILSVDKLKKSCLFYMSWMEAWTFLKNPLMWLPVASVQSSCLQSLVGGTSGVMLEILKRLVSKKFESGVTLECGLQFKQSCKAYFLADYEAIRSVYGTKGSAGLRPCILCRNLLKARSGLVEYDNYFVELSASHGFKLSSDSELFEVCDRMRHCRTKAELEMMEKTAGVTYADGSLLFSEEERAKLPPSRIIHDFLHTYLANGIASWEIVLFISQLETRTNVTLETLQSVALQAGWRGTKSSGKTQGYLRNLFHRRMFGEDVYKGQGHQTAALLPILRYYVETMIEPSNQMPRDYIRSFRTVCNIVSFVRDILYGLHTVESPDMKHLDKLQRMHQEYYKVYQVDHKPKHHHRFHIPSQWFQCKVPVSCEALEDKHRVYKSGIGTRLCSTVRDHHSFSHGVLTRLLETCLTQLKKNGMRFWELLPPIKDAPFDDKIYFATFDLKTSKSCQLVGCQLTEGDIILWQFSGGIVCDWFWNEKNGIYARCQKLDFVGEKTWGTTWRVSSDRVIMHVSPAATPTIPTWYRFSQDGQTVTCLR